jgi:hypothetical protein
MRKMPHCVFGSASGGATKRILIMIDLSKEQTALIRSAANSINPCWRQRFLASVEDHLLGHDPNHVSDEDVVKAIDGVRWAMFVGTVDDDD